MTGLARPMTSAIGFSAAALDRRDGAAAKIAELNHARQDVGASLFQRVEGIRQMAPPILPYVYVRIIAPKKENCQHLPFMSRTLLVSAVAFSTNMLVERPEGGQHPWVV